MCPNTQKIKAVDPMRARERNKNNILNRYLAENIDTPFYNTRISTNQNKGTHRSTDYNQIFASDFSSLSKLKFSYFFNFSIILQYYYNNVFIIFVFLVLSSNNSLIFFSDFEIIFFFALESFHTFDIFRPNPRYSIFSVLEMFVVE